MKKDFLLNDPNHKSLRQKLRKNMPEPEKRLWFLLRKRNISGVKFRRQYGVGKYILDFYCPEKRIAIEIDGETHYVNTHSREYDYEKDEFLKKNGIKVIRFTNREVIKNTYEVVEKIIEEIEHK